MILEIFTSVILFVLGYLGAAVVYSVYDLSRDFPDIVYVRDWLHVVVLGTVMLIGSLLTLVYVWFG